jgi:lipid-binding SYLF domain-containing protein
LIKSAASFAVIALPLIVATTLLGSSLAVASGPLGRKPEASVRGVAAEGVAGDWGRLEELWANADKAQNAKAGKNTLHFIN